MRIYIFASLLLLAACQPRANNALITIVDADQLHTSDASQFVPRLLLEDMGIVLGESDRVLMNGAAVLLDELVTVNNLVTLQVRRAVPVTLQMPNESRVILSSAFTVGEMLKDAGVNLSINDFIDSPISTPVTSSMIVKYIPARDLRIFIRDISLILSSAEGAVGRIMAEAGIPLVGLDYSLPLDSEAAPLDSQFRLVRVHESVSLTLKSIPRQDEYIASDDIELDQTEILQPGSDGLSISRIHTRFEDGQQVLREIDDDVIVRSPQKRVIGYGTKIVTHTIPGSTNIEYWRAVQMYATSYSPCRSGVPQCLSGTSFGLPVQKGVVAMKYDWYLQLAGQQVYIPGYGVAVVADVGGGFPDGRAWIDLGYSDSDWEEWSGWVTVYFLAPVPDSIPYILK